VAKTQAWQKRELFLKLFALPFVPSCIKPVWNKKSGRQLYGSFAQSRASSFFEKKKHHKFITWCSIADCGKVPGTLQYIAQTTKRNITRNVEQNPDHSQLIHKRKSRNKGAALNNSVMAPHVKWCCLTKRTLQGCLLGTGQNVWSPCNHYFCRWTNYNRSECELEFQPYCDCKGMHDYFEERISSWIPQ